MEEIVLSQEEYNELIENSKKWENSYKYLAADFENMKKRMSKELSDSKKFKNKDMILKILEVIDNCERSFEFDETNSPIYKQLNDILASENVEKIAINIGDCFDENVMNAISLTPNDGTMPSYCVTCIIKNGYRYKGEIIRFADVIVCQ